MQRRSGPRRRHYVSSGTLLALRFVGFVYDYPHDGYVLVLIGKRWGPVFRDSSRRL